MNRPTADDAFSDTRTERGAVDALLSATHGDPFAVLGPHEIAPGVRVVRCLVPGATRIEVIDHAGRPRGGLARLAGDVFAGRVDAPDGAFAYRLAIDGGPGAPGGRVIDDPYRFGPVLGELDLHLLGRGEHWRTWRVLGARQRTIDGVDGTAFAVWAPNARRVSVIGSFDGWDGRVHPMRRRVEVALQ